uniref:Transmembrane protein 238 n=1 Tax=Oncorhynchus tshawytscha TaxID=74940 RepID=A0A8C8M6P4_ONCTS
MHFLFGCRLYSSHSQPLQPSSDVCVCVCIGGCVPLFFLAIGFDVIGFIILFIGIFANLRIDGRFYGDFLIYSGSIIIFISLAWWIMWYVGNIQVSEDSFGTSLMKKKLSFVQLARKLSERLSKKCKPEHLTTKYAEENKVKAVTPSPVHVASRITWGKSFGYQNGGLPVPQKLHCQSRP